jgi:hypothetical protein
MLKGQAVTEEIRLFPFVTKERQLRKRFRFDFSSVAMHVCRGRSEIITLTIQSI